MCGVNRLSRIWLELKVLFCGIIVYFSKAVWQKNNKRMTSTREESCENYSIELWKKIWGVKQCGVCKIQKTQIIETNKGRHLEKNQKHNLETWKGLKVQFLPRKLILKRQSALFWIKETGTVHSLANTSSCRLGPKLTQWPWWAYLSE